MKKYFLIVLLFSSHVIFGQNPLLIPPTITGNSFVLNLQNGTVGFFPGPVTNTMGINGNILGPTLIMDADSSVNISVNNNLSDTTTIHWHGMHVSPENDGGPHTVILPGATWSPSFTIKDKASTYWYHPHLHRKTGDHVARGMAGLIIVKDAEESALNLPRNYGVDDFPLVLQTKAFDLSNQIMPLSHADSIFMINATIDPYLDAPAQIVRLRLLNGSSNRTFYMGFSNSMAFDQIASDGGLLAVPVNLTRLRLGPGERAEILVNLIGMQSQTVNLVNYCQELPIGLYGAQYPALNQFATLPDYPNNPLNLFNYTMLQINVQAQTGSPVTTIPSTLAVVTPLLEVNSNKTRTIQFGTAFAGNQFLTKPFLMNGVYFDKDTINEYVPLNNIEIWTLSNNTMTYHPFHIHDVQFYILDIDGNPPPLNEQGRKDVVLVPPTKIVRFIAQFSDFESNTIPYMYHCHMLSHEDMGMMGQFIVSSTINEVADIKINTSTTIYPNPSNGVITIENSNDLNSTLLLTDVSGKEIYSNEITGLKNIIDFSFLSNGLYLISVNDGNTTTTKKLLIKH